MSYKEKLPFISSILQELEKKPGCYPGLEELLIVYAKRQYFDFMIDYLVSTYSQETLIREINKITNDKMKLEIKSLLIG